MKLRRNSIEFAQVCKRYFLFYFCITTSHSNVLYATKSNSLCGLHLIGFLAIMLLSSSTFLLLYDALLFCLFCLFLTPFCFRCCCLRHNRYCITARYCTYVSYFVLFCFCFHNPTTNSNNKINAHTHTTRKLLTIYTYGSDLVAFQQMHE